MVRKSPTPPPVLGERSGYTILELLVVSLVLAILITLGFQGYQKWRGHAEKAVCLSNMRAVHAGLADHLVDKGYWPQPIMNFDTVSEEEYFGWWISAIVPYGVAPETWICPTDKVMNDPLRTGYRGSYIPTPFDAHPFTPMRWNQPWLMERGDLHGKGAHMAMPDGSIRPSMEVN